MKGITRGAVARAAKRTRHKQGVKTIGSPATLDQVETILRDATSTPATERARRSLRYVPRCGHTARATAGECGLLRRVDIPCNNRACPRCARLRARRAYAQTMERYAAVFSRKSRAWLVTLTTPYLVPDQVEQLDQVHQVESNFDATAAGDEARKGLRSLWSAWLAWIAWLRGIRTDVRLADAWAQTGAGGRWHVHAVIVTGETHARFRRGRHVLCDADQAREAWRQATNGEAWNIDLQSLGTGGPEGKRGCRAAYYAARYAGRGWDDGASAERVAAVLSGCGRAHLCRRSKVHVERPPKLCGYCGEPHRTRMVWKLSDFLKVVPEGSDFRWGMASDGRWGPLEDVTPADPAAPEGLTTWTPEHGMVFAAGDLVAVSSRPE